MLKSFTFSVLAMILVISILAPSIKALCKSNYDSALVMDLNEEENNKESEKKFDQNELFFSNHKEKDNPHFHKEIVKSQTSLFLYSVFSADIVLPPPKKLV